MTAGVGIESKAYRSRPARREDLAAIVHLYNSITGRTRTDAEHHWEWWEAPEGVGSMWVIEDATTGAIVGHHGLIPLCLRIDGRSILAGKTENTMVHPDHRDKVLYFLYERQFAAEAQERFDLLFTTSGYGTIGRIRRKLGYQSAGTTTFFLKITRSVGLTQLATPVLRNFTKVKAVNHFLILAASAVGKAAVLAFAGRAKSDSGIEVTRCTSLAQVSSEIELLWQHTAPKLGITVERSAAYLQWRLAANPNVLYAIFVARRGAQLAGYAAVELLADRQAVIVDILVEDNAAELFDGLLQGVVKQLDAQGYHTFVFPTLQSDNSLTRGLRRNGFYDLAPVMKRMYQRANREEPHFLVKAIDAGLAEHGLFDASCWYYTGLFAEGLSTGSIALRTAKAESVKNNRAE